MGSTVLLKYGISCDSARWCNFIPSVIKKKLNAASSRSASSCFLLFALCVCALLFPLFSCVASRTGNFQGWGNFWVGVLKCGRFAGLFECKLSTASCTCSFCTCCDHVHLYIFPLLFFFFFLVLRNIFRTIYTQVSLNLNANGGHFKFNTSKGRVGGNNFSCVNRFLCPPPPLLCLRTLCFKTCVFLAP